MPLQQAHYTVCKAGVIPGTRGYAFSAASPDWDAAVLREIESLSGYKLVREIEQKLGQAIAKAEDIGPIVAEAPKSLQFRKTATGLNVLSRTVYLGMADKRRLGNLFAHSLYTREVTDLGDACPAQLWEAGLWEDREGENQELPVLGSLDVARAFSPDDLLKFCRADARREHTVSVLSAILSCLFDDARQRRVLIVDRPENVAQWVALASQILPRCIVRDLTFTTYTGDPGAAPDCVVVGTLPGAPGLQLGSPNVRFGFWVFSFETDEFPEPPPPHPYVEMVLGVNDLQSFELPDGFLPWADRAITAAPTLRVELRDLLQLYHWLQEPDEIGESFHRALEIAKTVLVPHRSPALAEVWDALAGSVTPQRVVSASELAKTQIEAGYRGDPTVEDSWWSVVGAHLDALEADQIGEIGEALRGRGLDLSFLGARVGERGQRLLHAALDNAGAALPDRVALLLFLAANHLLADRKSPAIQRFLRDAADQGDIDALADGLDGDALRLLSAIARENGTHRAYLLMRIAGPPDSFAELVAEVSRVAKEIDLDDETTLALYNRAYHAFETPVELDAADAKRIESAIGAELLEKCHFAEIVVEGKKKPAPRTSPAPAESSAPDAKERKGLFGPLLSRFRGGKKSS